MLYGPLEAGIGRNVSGWRRRRRSALNNIEGAIARTLFKLAGVFFVAFASEVFFGLKMRRIDFCQ